MPPAARRLLDEAVRKNNPYTDTINLAMERMASMERAIREELPKAMQIGARTKSYTRMVIRKGFAANSDAQGWLYQVPDGRDLNLKRIVIVGDATGLYGLFVGSQDASGLREVMNATNNLTFSNGATGFGYADAFSNDIYVRGGDYLFIQFLGAASVNGHTIVATLEVERVIPVKREVSEAENYSMQVEPLETSRDQMDGTETGLTGELPDIAAHFAPDTEMDMESDGLDVTHTQQQEEEYQTALLPDVAAHLPPALRE